MSAISETTPRADLWASVGGSRVHYREAGSGRPLVHLHGSGGPSWDEAHTILATRFRVIEPDLPGFGETRLDPALENLPALALVIASFIGEVVGEASHVWGTSFGGRVAAWLALDYPAAVDRLVLESPSSFRPSSAAGSAQNAEIVSALTRGNPPEQELLDRLHEIQAPTLVLFGTDDQSIPPETGRLYKERLADCTFALVYQAGHIIRRDRPDAFTHLVSDFLERGPAFLVNRG